MIRALPSSVTRSPLFKNIAILAALSALFFSFSVLVRADESNEEPVLFNAPALLAPALPPAVPPTLGSISNQTITPGTTFTTTVSGTPGEVGDTLVYSFTTAPSGATIDAATGVIVWPTNVLDMGAHTLTVLVTESNGGTASKTFTVSVNIPLPLIAIPTFVTVPQGTAVPVVLGATGNVTGYVVTSLPTQGTLAAGTHTLVAGDLPYAIPFASGTLVYTPLSNGIIGDSFGFKVTNGIFFSSNADVFLVSSANIALSPTLDTIPDQTVGLGATVTVTAHATPGISGNTIAYSLSGTSTPAAVIDPTTGVFTWQPTALDVGTHTVGIVATESNGQSATTFFTITVNLGVQVPLIALPGIVTLTDLTPTLITLGASGNVTQRIITSVPSQGTLSAGAHNILASELPYVLTSGTTTVLYVPPTSGAIATTFNFKVTNGTDTSNEAAVFVSSNIPLPANPTLDPIANQTVTFGTTVTFTAHATPGVLGDTLTYSLSSTSPALATIDPVTGVFSWATSALSVGSHTFGVIVTQGNGQSAEQSVTITVNLGIQVPLFVFPGFVTVMQNTPKWIALAASGNVTGYIIDSLPTQGTLSSSGHTIVAGDLPYMLPLATSTVLYTPMADSVVTTAFSFKVTDGTNFSNSASIFLVSPTNPTLAPIADRTVAAGDTVFLVATSTPGTLGNTVSYSLASSSPFTATISSTTGAFFWFTTVADMGSHTVTIVATESNGLSTSQSFVITLVPSGAPVAIAGSSVVEKNTTKTIVLQSVGTTTSYIITDLPTSGTIKDGTHTILVTELPYHLVGGGNVITYTPNNEYVGSDMVEFKVTDGSHTSQTVLHTFTVINPLGPTMEPIGNQTVTAGGTVTVTASSTPAHAVDTISYSLASTSPAGASITTTGTFTWTTSASDVGSHTVTIVATESNGGTTTQSFIVTVNAVATTPTDTNTGGGGSSGGSGGGGGGGSIALFPNQSNPNPTNPTTTPVVPVTTPVTSNPQTPTNTNTTTNNNSNTNGGVVVGASTGNGLTGVIGSGAAIGAESTSTMATTTDVSQSAAVGNTETKGVPAWVWIVLGTLIIFGGGYWVYRLNTKTV